MRVLVFASVLLITILHIGHAYACSDPVGVKGQMIFNDDYKVMQFCDGTDWHAMLGNGGGGASVPKGAVMAFNLSACPSGWSAFTAAQGRFLRGVDPSGTIDPGGVRAVGSLQADEFKTHTHADNSFGNVSPNQWWINSGGAYGGNYATTTGASGGAETRPKNVAVLYCEKD